MGHHHMDPDVCVYGGDDLQLCISVGFYLSLVTRESEVESEVSENAKRPILGLFEYNKGDLNYCIKRHDDCGFGIHIVENVELEIGLVYVSYKI
jgi:hypothetical protein